MGQYTVSRDGTQKVHSRYSRKGVCTLTHIFPEDKEMTKSLLKKKKEHSRAGLQKKYGVHTNTALVRKIFCRFLIKLLERVANGDLFIFPGQTKANITLKQTPDDEVKKLRQSGKFADFDIVKAKFQIPRFSFDFGPKYNRKDRGIYVPPDIMRKALKNAENAKLPWTVIPKSIEYDN